MNTKHEHRDHLVDIGRQAIEHALRMIPHKSHTREVVEQRLTVLGTPEARKVLAGIQPETKYTQDSCIRRASAELLKLSISEKWISGSALTGNIFVPCWDAGSFSVRGTSSELERAWQDLNLFPLIVEAFRKH